MTVVMKMIQETLRDLARKVDRFGEIHESLMSDVVELQSELVATRRTMAALLATHTDPMGLRSAMAELEGLIVILTLVRTAVARHGQMTGSGRPSDAEGLWEYLARSASAVSLTAADAAPVGFAVGTEHDESGVPSVWNLMQWSPGQGRVEVQRQTVSRMEDADGSTWWAVFQTWDLWDLAMEGGHGLEDAFSSGGVALRGPAGALPTLLEVGWVDTLRAMAGSVVEHASAKEASEPAAPSRVRVFGGGVDV